MLNVFSCIDTSEDHESTKSSIIIEKGDMAYYIYGRICHILEANSKRPVFKHLKS